LPRLPVRINPCPIVESIFEIRFNSTVPWEILPGLLYAQIRERYPTEKKLPLADVPEALRKDADLANLPMMQFPGEKFVVQIGPRVVGLATTPNEYPGWLAIEPELEWLIARLKAAEIVAETERLGVRYIDFFSGNLFQNLLLSVQVDKLALNADECN